MLIRATAHVAPAIPVAAAPAVPAPIWEPLPASGPEPDPSVELPAPLAEAPRSNYVSAFDARDKYRGRGQYRGPKKGGWVKFAVLAAVFLLLGGIGVVGASKAGLFKKAGIPVGGEGGGEEQPIAHNSGGSGGGGGNEGGTGQFPRRMLAISIHSYLYANPLHNGDSGRADDDGSRTGTDACVRRLAERWKVSKDQLYHLTDAPLLADKKAKKDGGKEGKGAAMVPAQRLAKSMPLRGVIEGTVTEFCDTSREQDRIVILFAGHALEKGGKTYLVPIEGDLDEPDSLIPLDWFYEKVGACKAQEKVVIFDVCRLNPERGIERPTPGPMTEAMEAALHNSPDGVTVITTCSKGEQSIELEQFRADVTSDAPGIKGSSYDLYGGFFLSMLQVAGQLHALSPENKLPAPADSLPVERMAKWMREKLGEVVHYKFPDRKQTVKFTIKKRSDVPYNAAEAMPARFEFPTPPPSADPRAVTAIINEVSLPPVKAFREDAPPVSISDVMPFSAEAIKDYLAGELKPGDKPNDFQKAVIDAVAGVRALRSSAGGELPETFGGETDDKAKAELRKVQETPARVEADLKDLLDNLDKVAAERDKQKKRWQVNYDYVVAQLKLRVCYANQYNLALANVRSGKLPDLQKDQNGYRLSAEMNLDKNTGADYKEMFNEARKTLTEIAKQNPNTPWAVLAKSDRTVAIGLRLTGGTVGTR
jgi:hypothetical protein